jgi:Carboxypeptidase regulatory-like domain
LRALARDVLVASASLGVLLLLVAFAIAGPSAELETSVGPVVPRPGTSALVAGRVVAADGGGLEGAEIAVARSGRVLASATSNSSGAFRVALPGKCSTYAISLRASALGEDMRATSRRRLCPGDSLPVEARVVTQGHFLWVPGPR